MGRLEVRDQWESQAHQETRAPWVCQDRWECRECPGPRVPRVSPARADLKEVWAPRERGETTARWDCPAPRDRKVTAVLRAPEASGVSEASEGRPGLQGWTLLVLPGQTASQSRAVAGGRKTEGPAERLESSVQSRTM